MKNLKKLASLVMALTLTLGLCASIAGAAAEPLNKPTVFTTYKLTWTVTDPIKGTNLPEFSATYIDVWGNVKTTDTVFKIYINGVRDNDFYCNKGTFVRDTSERSDINHQVDKNIVKVTGLTMTAENALPTFSAKDIKVEIFHYYAPTKEIEARAMERQGGLDALSQCVLFRTETYTSPGPLVIQKNQKDKPISFPNFRTTVVDHVPYPGGLPSNATGSVFGDGNTVVLWAGVALLLIAVPTVIIIRRKKNKSAAQG